MVKEEQFDFIKGDFEKLQGMARAEKSPLAQDWKSRAWKWFYALPSGTTFSADDLRKEIGTPAEGANRNNAVGAFVSSLATRKLVRHTGRTRKSEAVSRHTGMQREWVKL